jgi:hypothetical protein
MMMMGFAADVLVCVHVAPCRKNQKALEAAVAEIGYAGLPRYHSRAVSGAYLALRGEILALLELRRQVNARSFNNSVSGACLCATRTCNGSLATISAC